MNSPFHMEVSSVMGVPQIIQVFQVFQITHHDFVSSSTGGDPPWRHPSSQPSVSAFSAAVAAAHWAEALQLLEIARCRARHGVAESDMD